MFIDLSKISIKVVISHTNPTNNSVYVAQMKQNKEYLGNK